MACGVGACLSCVVDTVDGKRRACVDGPVFPASEVVVVMQRKPKETSVNLSVNLGGMAMKNPVTVASGTFGAGMEYHDFVDVAALGAVTTKGVAQRLGGRCRPLASPRQPLGHAETPSGFRTPGVAHLKVELPWLASIGVTASGERDTGHSFDRVRGRHRGAGGGVSGRLRGEHLLPERGRWRHDHGLPRALRPEESSSMCRAAASARSS
ncbi:MAG: hypothetical protein ACLTDR_07270 [Adlercreutzia equolifaciens]